LKVLNYIFWALILLIQYPLWFDRGGWIKVFDLQSKYEIQVEINKKLEKENSALMAEVTDLKKGSDAIEERARDDLGMIKKGEIFFEIIK
jgi:cell division protein FtsB